MMVLTAIGAVAVCTVIAFGLNYLFTHVSLKGRRK